MLNHFSFCTAYCAILGTKQSGRYFHTVKPVKSNLTCILKKAIEKIECHSSCLSCEQYGNLDLQEPYCPSAFGCLQVQDSMAPSGQTFYTSPAFGGRNVTYRVFNDKCIKLYTIYYILQGLSEQSVHFCFHNFPGP
jgi:hypothetical protein